FSRKERCLKGISCQLAQVLLGKSEIVLGQLILAGKRSAKHGGIVGVQYDHQAIVEIVAHGVSRKGGTAPCTQVAGDAYLDGYLAPGKFLDQFPILLRRKPVPNSFLTKVKSSPYGFRPGGLPGVGGEAKAVFGGVGVNISEKLRSRAALVTRDAQAGRALTLV